MRETKSTRKAFLSAIGKGRKRERRQKKKHNKESRRTRECGVLLDITKGARLHNGTNEEALNGLVLGRETSTAIAIDAGNVATTVLGTTVIAALLGHL